MCWCIDAEMNAWDPKQGTNIWEHSGLFEGDIMLYKKKNLMKNGLVDVAARWDFATIPYSIDDSFGEYFCSCVMFVDFVLNSTFVLSDR